MRLFSTAPDDPDATIVKGLPAAAEPPDDERDPTVVRPSAFMPTIVLPGDPDKDATVVRPTLRMDGDRTLSRGAVIRPLPKQALALPKGLMLHEYRIERVLGQGGFGITYLATDNNLSAQVAIKEYLPEEIAFRTSERNVSPNASQHRDRYRQGLENFLVEARTLATFRHPNIVRVARFFEAHDTAYMVLEYERGRSLKKWWLGLRDNPEGVRLLIERLQRLLDGLAVVHSAGYLHRDIKPDNIQVRADDGRFVLLDFGSAGQTVALADQDAVVVTPGYAPIEQYGVGEQGAWTDIYALGATLYWVVAGRKPPDAESRANGTTAPSASEVGRGRFGPAFLSAIDWSLQLDAARRPKSVDEWRDQLLADYVVRSAAGPARRAESSFGSARAERSRGERWRSFVRRAFVPPAWPLAAKLVALALAAAVLMPLLLVGGYRLVAASRGLPSGPLEADRALVEVLGWGVVLAGLLFAWVALRFARGIVRSLEKLTAAAHALRAGDYVHAQVDVKRRDEVGQLARAFNGTVDVLRQRERERERTASRR